MLLVEILIASRMDGSYGIVTRDEFLKHYTESKASRGLTDLELAERLRADWSRLPEPPPRPEQPLSVWPSLECDEAPSSSPELQYSQDRSFYPEEPGALSVPRHKPLPRRGVPQLPPSVEGPAHEASPSTATCPRPHMSGV